MKYETIGGQTKDTNDLFSLIRHLKIGDRFRTKSSADLWEVRDEKCNWNGQAGSPTRKCLNLTKRTIEHKLCRTEVVKV